MYNLQNSYKNIYISSDFHAYHKNICIGSTCWDRGIRNFVDQFEMTTVLVNNINKIVKSDDLLIHLGDWSFGGYNRVREFRERINCEKVITLIGNHDRYIRKRKELQDLFEWVGYYLEIKYNRKKICMCHYPIISWNCRNSGSFMLHGHSHHNLSVNNPGRLLDVGVDGDDYGFRPLHIDYIYQRLKDIPIICPDHH